MLSPAVPLSQHLLLLLLFHPLLHCSSLLHAPSRSRYRVARTSMHRCALSRARSAFAHIRTQSRIEHRLPALTGRVQRSLGSHRLALSRPGRSAWSTSRSFSPSPFPSPPLSLFFCTRALAPSIATSLAPLVTTDTSYLVLSLPASRPFLLSSSFPPFLPPIDSSCFCTLPPCRPFFATRSLLYRYSRSYFADLLSFSLSLFVSRTDGNAERNGPERQCGQRRCTHRTVQRWTLMD